MRRSKSDTTPHPLGIGNIKRVVLKSVVVICEDPTLTVFHTRVDDLSYNPVELPTSKENEWSGPAPFAYGRCALKSAREPTRKTKT